MNYFLDYEPVLDLKQTLSALNNMKHLFVRNIKRLHNLSPFPSPTIIPSEFGLNSHITSESRFINFDSRYLDQQVIEYLLYANKYKRWILNNFKDLKGIVFLHEFLKRDTKISSISALNQLFLEYEKKWDLNDEMKVFFVDNQKTIQHIQTWANAIRKHYKIPGEHLTFPTNNLFDWKTINKKYKNIPSRFEILNFIGEEYGGFFIQDLDYDHVDNIANYDYQSCTWKYLYRYYYYYPIINKTLLLMEFSIAPTKNIIKQQKDKIKSSVLDNNFYSKLLEKDDFFVTCGGRINLPLMQMVTLQKIHLAEVISSIWTDEEHKKLKKLQLNIFL